MLRGLLLPSIVESGGASIEQPGNALTASPREQRAAATMLLSTGPGSTATRRSSRSQQPSSHSSRRSPRWWPARRGRSSGSSTSASCCWPCRRRWPAAPRRRPSGPQRASWRPCTSRCQTWRPSWPRRRPPSRARRWSRSWLISPTLMAKPIGKRFETGCRNSLLPLRLTCRLAQRPPQMLVKRWHVIRRLRFAEDGFNEPRPLVP